MSSRRDFLAQTAAVGLAAASAPIKSAIAEDAPRGPKRPLNTYAIPNTDLRVSRIAYGCAMLGLDWDSPDFVARTVPMIHVAYEQGVTLFDVADSYGFGKAELALGEVLKNSPGLRHKIVIQSKCGERFEGQPQPEDPHRADFSYEHIVSAAESSLVRLSTDHLDILLLHFPDPLVKPEEVARAFDELHRHGKVRYFGVSNHTAMQIELLKKHVRQPLVVNQIHVGLGHSYAIADGAEFTLDLTKGALQATHHLPITRPRRPEYGYMGLPGTGTLDYCRLHDIQIQAYSPLRGVLNPPADASADAKLTAQILSELAKKKDTSPAAVALAWLLHHPAGIIPVLGAMKPEYVIEDCKSDRVVLSREEWYTLFGCAGDARFI